MSSQALWQAPGGWWLTPEGATVHLGERTAVIADVHLGYEWARASAGDCVPAHSLTETLERLSCLLARAPVARLVVAGDLVESRTYCRRTSEDLRQLTDWLSERGVSLIALEGNHDPPRKAGRAATLEVAGWTIGHGHRPIAGPCTISGHHHPILRLDGISALCFLVSEKAILLPAFSLNAAGWNVLAAAPPGPWQKERTRCVASAGNELLDFGMRSSLQQRLSSRPVGSSRTHPAI